MCITLLFCLFLLTFSCFIVCNGRDYGFIKYNWIIWKYVLLYEDKSRSSSLLFSHLLSFPWLSSPSLSSTVISSLLSSAPPLLSRSLLFSSVLHVSPPHIWSYILLSSHLFSFPLLPSCLFSSPPISFYLFNCYINEPTTPLININIYLEGHFEHIWISPNIYYNYGPGTLPLKQVTCTLVEPLNNIE